MAERCVMKTNKIQCPEPATAMVGNGCEPCGIQHFNPMCARHLATALTKDFYCRYCNEPITMGEPIDLVRADPGPEYAELLRGL
jgi:hypothetical protein